MDDWEPREADWKDHAEQAAVHDSSKFDGALIETTCPGCGHLVGALVVDGPDPVFVNVVCPRDVCQHEFTERVA